MAIQTQAKIPVLDFSNDDLKPGTSTSWFSARKDVCRALEEYGCFVAELGNKVALELHDTMFGAVRELFDFPTVTKAKITNFKKPLRGYLSRGLRERILIDISPEASQELTNLFWPNGNDNFRGIADPYLKLMSELDKMVTRMVFENYGMEKYYDSHMKLTTRSVIYLKYKEPPKSGTVEGLETHTDPYFITILKQNRVKGLEIKTKNGEWIGFDPSPSSFLFLAGDALQVWSNDRIEACVHRVMLTENETRYSVGSFAFADGTIHVPEELVDEKHPLQYKPLNIVEYLKTISVHGKKPSVKAYYGV